MFVRGLLSKLGVRQDVAIAETVGTFILCFITALMASVAPQLTAYVVSFTIFLVVLGFGHISCHFNPAVTCSVWLASSSISSVTATVITTLHYVGGCLAGVLLLCIKPNRLTQTHTEETICAPSSIMTATIVETFISFVFCSLMTLVLLHIGDEHSKANSFANNSALSLRRTTLAACVAFSYLVTLPLVRSAHGSFSNPAYFWGSNLPAAVHSGISVHQSLCMLPYSTGPYLGSALAGLFVRLLKLGDKNTFKDRSVYYTNTPINKLMKDALIEVVDESHFFSDSTSTLDTIRNDTYTEESALLYYNK